jgi:hypothetical protein
MSGNQLRRLHYAHCISQLHMLALLLLLVLLHQRRPLMRVISTAFVCRFMIVREEKLELAKLTGAHSCA